MRHFLVIFTLCLGLIIPGTSLWGKQAEAQKTGSAPVRIEGFRSAHFGMNVNEVRRAIQSDFKISKRGVHKEIHFVEQTESLWVLVKNLLPGSGPGKIFYIFGFKSKRLIQVNVTWGRLATENPNPEKVLATANRLRDHFIRKGFEKEGLMANAPLGNGMILVFRGKDSKGRMVVLLLTNPTAKSKKTNENISLRLSYISNPENPDVFRIKKDDF